MIGALLLAAAALPPVIADPRGGTSDWQLLASVSSDASHEAAGYIVGLPAGGSAGQGWLERVVALSAAGKPVLLAAGSPPAEVLPYVDGVVIEGGGPSAVEAFRSSHPGVPVVVPVTGPDDAVAALAAGAAAVLVATPPPAWQSALAALLPDPTPARCDGEPLATAMRGRDLATVIGLPRGFPGGRVALPGAWFGTATLLGAGRVAVDVRADGATVLLPRLPEGDVLVVERPAEEVGRAEAIEVTAERIPTAAEILARHQLQQAQQDRAFTTFEADQSVAIRVWIGELSRSFELNLDGPAFFARDTGTDWEIARVRVDGVVWPAHALPDLPLIEPSRPPVPPLALRIDPSYRYTLVGVEARSGRRCFGLGFESEGSGTRGRRHGTAWIDASTFGLVELDETTEDLPGEVRATRSVTVYQPLARDGVPIWLPARVTADDLVAAFGGTATLHRELTLSGIVLEPPGFKTDRAAAWGRDDQMLRDTPAGLKRLVPDGQGGRTVEGQARPAQRFLLGGLVVDPGFDFPVPFGGLQIQDFDFRGRGEQLRVFAAGVVNDAAWSRRVGRLEVSLRGFVQLLGFSSSVYLRGKEHKDESVETRTQRVGAGVATVLGPARVLVDVGVNRLDFARAADTGADFVVPRDTFEGVVKLEATAVLGPTTLAASAESGRRQHWSAWGPDGTEPPRRSWRRFHVSVVHEQSPFPFAKFTVAAEAWGGEDLDRFSAPSPGRFGGVSLRGIASGRVLADRLAVARAALAVPMTQRIRFELGVDAAWVRDRRSGYELRPLSGVGVGMSFPGPFGTLLQARVGVPLATPGPRQAAAEVFVLRPLSR